MVSAQGWRPNRPNIPAPEAVTVSGSMIVAHGMPAIKSGDVTYLVPGISRLTGFIDGLKEGAQVTIEGSAMAQPKNSNVKFLVPTKLTLSGRTYDLEPLAWNPGSMGPRFQPPPRHQGPSPRRPNPQPNFPQRRQR